MSVTRPLTIGLSSLLALAAATTGVAAQEVDVSASATAGSRQFFVEDLAGAPLTALDLGTSGDGLPFQTRVADTNFTGTGDAFTASAEMTRLYLVDGAGLDYATRVTSDKLAVSFPTSPTDVAGVSLGATPQIGIAGLLPTCTDLPGLLPTDSVLRNSGGLLNTLLNPLNALLNTLDLSSAARPLCSALGGTSTTPLPINAADAVLLTLQESVLTPLLTDLPLNVAGSTEAGNFADPSFLGDGAGDPAANATAATARTVLAGDPNEALDLDALVSALIDGVPLFPSTPGGTDGLTTVAAVVAALQSSPDTGIAAIGNALAGLSAADQTGVLSGLEEAVAGTPVATLADTVLNRITGTYRSFPRLNADLTGAVTGTYSGTMTVTFVQE